VRELLDLGVREIVVKRGATGSSYYDAEQRIDVPGSQSKRWIRPAPATVSAPPL